MQKTWHDIEIRNTSLCVSYTSFQITTYILMRSTYYGLRRGPFILYLYQRSDVRFSRLPLRACDFHKSLRFLDLQITLNSLRRLQTMELDSWPLKMGPIVCPETSVRNYHYLLRNNPEERSSQNFSLCFFAKDYLPLH